MNQPSASPTFSRREFLVRGGYTLAAMSWLAGCTSTPTRWPSSTPMPTPTTARRVAATPPDDLDAQLGQMLLVGFRGLELTADHPLLKDLRERNLGGVVLFDYDGLTKQYVRNVQSSAQLKALTAALQRNAATRLLIAIDQEGGNVARLKERWGFPPTLSAQTLGARNDLAATRQAGEAMAKTLADHGINLNFAPVVDLNVNPNNPVIGKFERSFSADPKIVTRHALEMVQAHHKFGVLTTLKHFPGHGSSQDDSHFNFVDVTKTWTRAELEPYTQLIQAGQCDAVMTAHIFNATLDPTLPATLSKLMVTGILREELRFDGVVISDDLQMKAIADYYGWETALELAVNAGVDILAIANNVAFDENIVAHALVALKQAVQTGKISRARIEQASQRIARFKARLS